jgi:hypothetical protein
VYQQYNDRQELYAYVEYERHFTAKTKLAKMEVEDFDAEECPLAEGNAMGATERPDKAEDRAAS